MSTKYSKTSLVTAATAVTIALTISSPLWARSPTAQAANPNEAWSGSVHPKLYLPASVLR